MKETYHNVIERLSHLFYINQKLIPRTRYRIDSLFNSISLYMCTPLSDFISFSILFLTETLEVDISHDLYDYISRNVYVFVYLDVNLTHLGYNVIYTYIATYPITSRPDHKHRVLHNNSTLHVQKDVK